MPQASSHGDAIGTAVVISEATKSNVVGEEHGQERSQGMRIAVYGVVVQGIVPWRFEAENGLSREISPSPNRPFEMGMELV